jgi:hypothetical protein
MKLPRQAGLRRKAKTCGQAVSKGADGSGHTIV